MLASSPTTNELIEVFHCENESVVDRPFDKNARAREADLSGVKEKSFQDTRNSRHQVCVGKYDVR